MAALCCACLLATKYIPVVADHAITPRITMCSLYRYVYIYIYVYIYRERYIFTFLVRAWREDAQTDGFRVEWAMMDGLIRFAIRVAWEASAE